MKRIFFLILFLLLVNETCVAQGFLWDGSPKSEEPKIQIFNATFDKVWKAASGVWDSLNIPTLWRLPEIETVSGKEGILESDTIQISLDTLKAWMLGWKPESGWQKGMYFVKLKFKPLSRKKTQIEVYFRLEAFGVQFAAMTRRPWWHWCQSNGEFEKRILSLIERKIESKF